MVTPSFNSQQLCSTFETEFVGQGFNLYAFCVPINPNFHRFRSQVLEFIGVEVAESPCRSLRYSAEGITRTNRRRVVVLRINGGSGQNRGLGIQSVLDGARCHHHISNCYFLRQCIPWSRLAQRSNRTYLASPCSSLSYFIISHNLGILFGFL